MPVPRYFCWTKFGIEAGEPLDRIIQRKERERRINGGIFLWGIGNALGPSLFHLLQFVKSPEVIFSPIRSAPRKKDISPERIVSWMGGVTMEGKFYKIPSASSVTSRGLIDGKKSHYALVCESQENLKIDFNGELFDSGQLRNIRTGRPVGFSQVTSIVIREKEKSRANTPPYPVAMRVKLVYPYFLKLLNPIDLD